MILALPWRDDDVIDRINDAGGLQVCGITAVNGDALVLDEHGGVKTRAATAIDDESVFDEHV